MCLAAGPRARAATVTWEHTAGGQFDTLLVNRVKLTPDIYSDAQVLNDFLKKNGMIDSGMAVDILIPQDAWKASGVTWPNLAPPVAKYFDELTKGRAQYHIIQTQWLVLALFRYQLYCSPGETGARWSIDGEKFGGLSKIKEFFSSPMVKGPAVVDLIVVSSGSIVDKLFDPVPSELKHLFEKKQIAVHVHFGKVDK